MRTLGVLLLAAGSVALWVLGRNYGLCHQWWIDSTQTACRDADTAHVMGIWLMILGGLSVVGGQIASGRQDGRITQGRTSGEAGNGDDLARDVTIGPASLCQAHAGRRGQVGGDGRAGNGAPHCARWGS